MNKRVQAFLDKMQEKELDGIIINNLKNVYYLTGFYRCQARSYWF